ncbi:hypothetical protein [Haliscomenobacter sp.]|uniref:hypothetical protein n=1 Tax=Haliscomenobacter sp. TaxID=2717303 RepID=UPI00359347AE
MQEIEKKYLEHGGEAGPLGAPTSDYDLNPDQLGFRRHYKNGSIYWHPATGARMVFGSIHRLWSNPHREEKGERDGWEQGPLGYPLTDERVTLDRVAAYSHFQRGSIYSHPVQGTWRLQGIVRELWANAGWERSKYGYPTSDTDLREDGLTHFGLFQHGVIEWFPHTPYQAVQAKYAAFGGESVLGKVKSAFRLCPDGVGYFQCFEHGCIYWHPSAGTNMISSFLLRKKTGDVNLESPFLGYPIQDEMDTPGQTGRFCAFLHEHTFIYWKKGSEKAFEVHGDIGKQYAALGWEQSPLGFPISDEIDSDRPEFKRLNRFEGGTIYWKNGETQVFRK